MVKRNKEFWLIILAFFIIYIVWGSTYLANAWGVKSVPPLIFAGARFLLGGVLLLGIARLFGPIKVSKKQLVNTMIAGVVLFTIGNGMVVWSLQFLDSGITALFVAFEPLIVAVLLWKFKNQKPKKDTWIGITLGILGILLLVGQPKFATDPQFLLGLAAIMIALLSWGFISIWIPDADLPESIMQSAALQMIMGGVGLFIGSFLFGEFNDLKQIEFNETAFWSFAFLVVFGSIFAFSAFNYLLKTVSPTKVVTSAYVNPVVALFLGWWLNSEILSTQSFIAASVLLTGVFFINRSKSTKKV